MPSMPLLTVAELRGTAGQIQMPDGTVHDVAPMDGAAFRDLQIIADRYKAQRASGDDVTMMYEIAARCVPSLDREAIYHLTVPQINAIIAMASNQIEVVEALVREVAEKNGARPAATAVETAPAPVSPAGVTTDLVADLVTDSASPETLSSPKDSATPIRLAS